MPRLDFCPLTFRQCASCILGQAFHYSPENAFYIFNQQIRGLLEKYPTLGREKETGLLGALDT